MKDNGAQSLEKHASKIDVPKIAHSNNLGRYINVVCA